MDVTTSPEASLAPAHLTDKADGLETLSRSLPYLFLLIILCVTPLVLNRSKLSKFPDVTVPASVFDVGNTKARRQFVTDATRLIKDGFAKASSQGKAISQVCANTRCTTVGWKHHTFPYHR